jgi:hypothetical protein
VPRLKEEDASQLVADRFAVEDDGRCDRSATGARVTMTIGSAGGVTEQMRWAVRCDQLRTLHHQAIAPLLDFGTLGETSRFEAWCCGPPWPGAPEAAHAAYDAASRFLQAEGLSAPAAPGSARVGGNGAVLILPDVDTGYPSGADVPASNDMPLHRRGVSFVSRPRPRRSRRCCARVRSAPARVGALGTAGFGQDRRSELARMGRLRGLSDRA